MCIDLALSLTQSRRVEYSDLALGSIGETRSTLDLSCVTEDTAGIYECVADNQLGKVDSVATSFKVASELLH